MKTLDFKLKKTILHFLSFPEATNPLLYLGYILVMTLIILNLIGSVLLLLWSTSYVSKCIIKSFGGEVRYILTDRVTNPITAFITGFGTTALLQSSTATALMTASFIERGMIQLSLAIAVIIGADLSTTIIAQLLIFDLSWISPLAICIGAALSLGKANIGTRVETAGKALVGLGLMLLSLSLIKTAAIPLKESVILVDVLTSLGSDPFITILFSAVITFAIQSSLATILFYATLASQGLIQIEMGILLVIGANLGSATIPYIITRGTGTEKKRLFTMNLIMKATIAIIAWATAPYATKSLTLLFEDADRVLIMYHTMFAAASVILFLPFTNKIANISKNLVKDAKTPAMPLQAKKRSLFDSQSLDTPSIALGNALRATLIMSDMIHDMTEMTFNALKRNDSLTLQYAKDKDDELDKIYKDITLFLTKLPQSTLTEAETAQYERIINYATNLEHSGDVIQHSLSKTINKKIQLKHDFSADGWEEIKGFYDNALKSISTSQSVFISNSLDLSESLIMQKHYTKDIERTSRRNHFNRLRDQNPDSLITRDIHIDLIRDLGRISSYVASIAYDTINSSEENITVESNG